MECERSHGERERKREIAVSGEEDSRRIATAAAVRETLQRGATALKQRASSRRDKKGRASERGSSASDACNCKRSCETAAAAHSLTHARIRSPSRSRSACRLPIHFQGPDTGLVPRWRFGIHSHRRLTTTGDWILGLRPRSIRSMTVFVFYTATCLNVVHKIMCRLEIRE